MDFQNLLATAEQLDQKSLVSEIVAAKERLLPSQINFLHSQLFSLDKKTLKEQKSLIFSSLKETDPLIEPLDSWITEDLIPENLAPLSYSACLLVAGGQGSRLEFDRPKGCYPICQKTGKTLFEIHANRVLKASQSVKKSLPLAIMTSPLNHEETKSFFREHSNFGLKEDQIHIFSQPVLPFLDDQGNLFCDQIGHLAVGPNGNGAALQALVASGIAANWQKKGVRYVTFMQVDNVLGDPFSKSLISHHASSNSCVTIRSVMRVDPDEPVGILVKKNHSVQVVEYSEVGKEVRYAKNRDGSLSYPCANISHYCFSLDFINRVSLIRWPLHLAYKKIGKPDKPSFKAWKFEFFIFDALPFAKKVEIVVTPREDCFAPLKSSDGPDGPEAVRKALEIYHKKKGTRSQG